MATEIDPGPLDRALEEARDADGGPPLGLRAGVMRRIHDAQAAMSLWRRWRRAGRATNLLRAAGVDPASIEIVTDNRRSAVTGEIIMRKIVWGIAGVGAVAVVGFVWFGYSPTGPGTEGTVGGAQRYQAAPAGDKSAALGDMSVQAFLQTDTFDRLTKNPDTHAILQKAATDPAFQKALTEPAFLAALANPNFQKAFADPAMQKAMANAAFQKAIADPAMQQALADAAFQKAIASPAMRKALADAAFQNAIADRALLLGLADAGFHLAMACPAMR
jgi:hypothetical protein